MSLFVSAFRTVYKISGVKKVYSRPAEELLKEVEKLNRNRGFYMPADNKAHYEKKEIRGFPCLIVRENLIAAVALTRDKTILMIAHRLKTVRHADQVLVVDQGRIVQRGTPEQLISQPGIYADFVGGRRKAEGWKI